MIVLKFILALFIGLGWLFFGGEKSKEVALILAIFVFLVLLITPKKVESIEEKEEFREKVKDRQIRKIALTEERILEKQAQKENKK